MLPADLPRTITQECMPLSYTYRNNFCPTLYNQKRCKSICKIFMISMCGLNNCFNFYIPNLFYFYAANLRPVAQKPVCHHANMSVKCTPPYTPLLYSKTGVYRGIHYFLIFVLKHRLWSLVRTASLRRF